MKKNSKLNEYIKYFKELWAVPRYRAIIKLSLYALMFFVLFLMANIYQKGKSEELVSEEKYTYTDIINNTNLNNLSIDYTITTSQTYTIDGEINNNILTGYIENNEILKKITIKENNIYKINSGIETYDSELNTNLIGFFLLPSNIIELVNDKQSYIEKTENQSFYTYNILYNNIQYEIKLISNLNKITNIEIKNEQVEYSLNFDFDK